MSGTVIPSAEEWLNARARISHDILRRALIPWCLRLIRTLDGEVRDEALLAAPVCGVAPQFSELWSELDWLLEHVSTMSPSKILFPREQISPSDPRSDYVRLLDTNWRERLFLDSICASALEVRDEVSLRYHELEQMSHAASTTLSERTHQKEVVIRLRAALTHLSQTLEKLPARIEIV